MNLSATTITRSDTGLYTTGPVYTTIDGVRVRVSPGYVAHTREEVIRMAVINTYIKWMRITLARRLGDSFAHR